MGLRPFRILVTRSFGQASELADRLSQLGAAPVLIPSIEITAPSSLHALDTAIASLTSGPVSPASGHPPFHWLIFTSANAVDAFSLRLQSLPYSCAREIFPPTAAIGSATGRSLQAIGITPALIPPQAVAESLAQALLPHALQPDGTPTRFLLVRAEQAREHLPETLRAAGAHVTIAPAYRTIIPGASVDAVRDLFRSPDTLPDAITFTSSSTARNLFTLLEAAGVTVEPDPEDQTEKDQPGKDQPGELVLLRAAQDPLLQPTRPILASIGPITSATLRELGHPPHVEATEATITSLAENLVKYLSLRKSL